MKGFEPTLLGEQWGISKKDPVKNTVKLFQYFVQGDTSAQQGDTHQWKAGWILPITYTPINTTIPYSSSKEVVTTDTSSTTSTNSKVLTLDLADALPTVPASNTDIKQDTVSMKSFQARVWEIYTVHDGKGDAFDTHAFMAEVHQKKLFRFRKGRAVYPGPENVPINWVEIYGFQVGVPFTEWCVEYLKTNPNKHVV